ncbi:MAG: hypothetical protein GC157_10580 [Frankiales bacterium]|nr:hypothetical protein [Frankiales bacterium]
MTSSALAASDWPASLPGNVVIVLALVLALVAAVYAALSRRLPVWVYALVGVVEVAVVWLTVACAVAWAGGTAPADPVVFLAYLAVTLAAAPGAAWWGAAEPGRWGGGVVAVAALVVPVLVLRLEQVWTGTPGVGGG